MPRCRSPQSVENSVARRSYLAGRSGPGRGGQRQPGSSARRHHGVERDDRLGEQVLDHIATSPSLRLIPWKAPLILLTQRAQHEGERVPAECGR